MFKKPHPRYSTGYCHPLLPPPRTYLCKTPIARIDTDTSITLIPKRKKNWCSFCNVLYSSICSERLFQKPSPLVRAVSIFVNIAVDTAAPTKSTSNPISTLLPLTLRVHIEGKERELMTLKSIWGMSIKIRFQTNRPHIIGLQQGP